MGLESGGKPIHLERGGSEIKQKGKSILNWTVFNAATSHPKACITKVAIVLPTYLHWLMLELNFDSLIRVT